MKFARYLEETQTPEWKKAYIDYRGLKKRITAIKRAHLADSQPNTDDDLVLSPTAATFHGGAVDGVPRHSNDSSTSAGPSPPQVHPVEDSQLPGLEEERGPSLEAPDDQVELPQDSQQTAHNELPRPSSRPSIAIRATTTDAVMSHRPRRGRSNTVTTAISRALQRANSTKGSAPNDAPRFDVRHPIPLMELLPQLTPVERAFFEKLDEELDKVESFFCERERDMRHRAKLLKEQLQELKDHRRAFYDAHPSAIAPYSWLALPLPAPVLPNILIHRRLGADSLAHTHQLPPPVPKSVRSWKQAFTHSRRTSEEQGRPVLVEGTSGVVEPSIPKARTKQIESTDSEDNEAVHVEEENAGFSASKSEHDGNQTDSSGTLGRSTHRKKSKILSKHMSARFLFRPGTGPEERKKGSDTDADAEDNGHSSGDGAVGEEPLKTPGSPGKAAAKGPRYDPEEYQHAKKQLKKAVLECYRGLELLNNYRTLNLIGFRKALKKFEKVTHIPAQQAYTKEKIEPSAFSSGQTVDALIQDMETLFAARFARGDKKKAMARLRGGSQHTSHHFSTFRTGMLLGFAVPALVAGIYQSFQSDTREAIPGWGGLLYIYGIFFVPTFFALIVGANLLVWARARINYVFIFELDLRTKMDHRVYFEMPAFLLSLLCYAFWLSFARIGSENVAPTTWPLMWLAFVAIVMVDPLPMMFKPSRWWFLRNVGRLLTSGVHRVEFADFWMGDQFCSLVYTLSNLYYVGCVYVSGIDADWRKCTPNTGPRWGIAFLLGSLPLFIRLVQSVKRYVDSGLVTHLINGGKYGSGIVYYLFYFLWRAQGGLRGPIFVLWCIFATNYSLYAGAWDLLMDWSLLRPHAPFPLLRPNLLYSNNIPFYYFAIAFNMLIRFIWVLYIPINGPNYILRTFIAAMLEALRRWQWNFLRLENEHLGNIDQYRVTREVPLPYSYEDHSHDSDGDDDEDAQSHNTHMRSSSKSWRTRRQSPHWDETAAEAGLGEDSGDSPEDY